MLVLDPGPSPSPSPRLKASSENQIGNVSFHSSWNNKTHKFMQSLLEHKVTICCVLGTHTQTHAHRDKERKKESNTQIRAQSKGFHCPFTPDERVREHRIRPLEINEDVFAAFVYSMQTSCRLRGLHPSPIPNPFFHRTQTHGWTECVSRFSAADHTGQQKQQQRLGSLSCIPLKHELAFLP